ncbi:UNVERIFIED_CONTAM: hypothetical protein Sradi_4034600 [Sesamum radiatum]|uniref:Uncharacterized protein n=1 Tax=Sesamum radiatum TaxID=300843 RepID=A0AAW2PI23_SESRA
MEIHKILWELGCRKAKGDMGTIETASTRVGQTMACHRTISMKSWHRMRNMGLYRERNGKSMIFGRVFAIVSFMILVLKVRFSCRAIIAKPPIQLKPASTALAPHPAGPNYFR